jgi:hypothetical protein
MHLELMRDTAKRMPLIDEPESYDSARIWHCKYVTLAPLERFIKIRALSIATVPDLSLSFLSTLRKLEWLSLLHLPNITDLSPLADLPDLRFLELSTLPGWDASGKRTVVSALEPLQALPFLEHVSLLGVVPADKSLSPLERCRHLTSARFHGVAPEEKSRFFAVTGAADMHIPKPSYISWPMG